MEEERRKTDVQIARLEERIKNLDSKLDERSATILRELKEVKESILPRLERVEALKLSASDFISFKEDYVESDSDKEARLRFIERYLWGAIGILALIQFIGFAYLVTFHK